MLRSILAFTVRNLIRNGSYSFFALSGLVIGITSAVLILLWVGYELRYDRYHPDNDRSFVILFNEVAGGDVHTQEDTPVPLTDFLSTGIPEVEAMTRIDNDEVTLRVGDKEVERNGVYVDSGYFTVFNLNLLDGSSHLALQDKQSIALSESLATILFGDNPAIGKFVKFPDNKEYKVMAVYEDLPMNSSLGYAKFVLPIQAKPNYSDDWQNFYIKLRPGASVESVEKKINAELATFFDNKNNTSLLFALTDWRLHWNFENGKQAGGRIVYVTIFGFAAIMILLMACINYMNMATARATRRAKEIGIRKATGATQKTLIRQFLTESILLSSIATAISALAVYLLMPLFRLLTGIYIPLSLQAPETWFSLLGVAIFTGLIAGSYPAFLLSAFRPALVLKGQINSVFTGVNVRKALVVFQFALSVAMIFGALVLWRQTHFLLNKEVGYDKHNVINVWLPGDESFPLQAFKAEVLAHQSVLSAGYGGASPMEWNGYDQVKWPGMNPNQELLLFGGSVDADMFSTLNMKISQGRNFSAAFASDSNTFIINKKAAALMGMQNPVGQTITYSKENPRHGEIIGVIDDFNNDDIHLPIAPIIFYLGNSTNLFNMFVRYREGEMETAVGHLETVYSKFHPDETAQISFLDSDYETQLHQERFLNKLAITFTVVAILIASLGLLGLTMFNAERRTKEIGIRKVLGATVSQVIMLLFREFLRPVILSLAIAFPIAYYFMQTYLESFPFRITISGYYFVGVGLLVFTIVLTIVVTQSFKAATKNPVESLKVE
jgi:putative ABC transport system permease protein